MERLVGVIGLEEGGWDNWGSEGVQEDLFLAAGRDEAVWLERAQGELCWSFLDLWVYMGSRWTGRLDGSVDCMKSRQCLLS